MRVCTHSCWHGGFVYMRGDHVYGLLLYRRRGPTPATQGSCYLLCQCSWGDFNEHFCSRPLLAPVRLHTGLHRAPHHLLLCRAGPSTIRKTCRLWGAQGIELNNWCVKFMREHLKSLSKHMPVITLCPFAGVKEALQPGCVVKSFVLPLQGLLELFHFYQSKLKKTIIGHQFI